MRHWTDQLVDVGACEDAVEWAKDYKTPTAAWKACERGDWMLWWAGKLCGPSESKSRKKLVLAACECARLSLKHVKKSEKQPLQAIETAESWARDEGATLKQVRIAYAATAADAAYAAYAAAAYAVDAAYAVKKKTLANCADIVRKYYPRPSRKEKP